MPTDELETLWDDRRRSLARKGRSDATATVYRKSSEQFWQWAIGAGIKTDPAAVYCKVVDPLLGCDSTTTACQRG